MTTTSGGRPPEPSDGGTTPSASKASKPKAKPALSRPQAKTAATKPGPKPASLAPSAAPAPPAAVNPPAALLPQGAVVPPAANPLPPRQRRLRVTITQVDPWTVLRLAFLLSVAAAVITVVAVMMLWGMLQVAGVFGSVDETLESVLGDGAVTITQYFSFVRVFSVALLIGAIDVVLITALATIGAFLYNLAASLTGGLEMTVSEDS